MKHKSNTILNLEIAWMILENAVNKKVHLKKSLQYSFLTRLVKKSQAVDKKIYKLVSKVEKKSLMV